MIKFAVIVAAIAVAAGAMAQPYYGYPPPSPYPPGPYRGVYPNPYFQGRSFGAPNATCQKLCLQDYAPCDPPEYKNADGRCSNPARGRGS